MRKRWAAALIAAIALVAAAWFGWRWAVQSVDVVIVNASGTPVQFSWQPQLFADEVTTTINGCESKSIDLRAGETWRLDSDRLEMHSSIVDVPPLMPRVAVEIWLAGDGSSRFVPAYPVDRPIDAPSPTGCPAP